MHYSDGQEAKLGDVVYIPVKEEYTGGVELIGILVTGAITNQETCNGNIQVILRRDKSVLGFSHWYPHTNHGQIMIFTIKEAKKLV